MREVLIDTSIWSSLLRKKQEDYQSQLLDLIDQGSVRIIGPIRQELLSGIKDINQFEILQSRLRAFPDVTIATETYEMAAQHYNICRSHGVQGSHIDFLITAVAQYSDFEIWTDDKDFGRYAQYVSIRLFES